MRLLKLRSSAGGRRKFHLFGEEFCQEKPALGVRCAHPQPATDSIHDNGEGNEFCAVFEMLGETFQPVEEKGSL